MKAVAIAVMAMIFTFSAFSQTKKGEKLAGVNLGSLSYNSTKTKSVTGPSTSYEGKVNSFVVALTPSLAYFVKDDLAVGAGIEMSFAYWTNHAQGSDSKSKSHSARFYLSPMARYYFGGSNKGKPFSQADFSIGMVGGKSESNNVFGVSESKTKPKGDWKAALSIGYEHFFSSSIGMYGSLGMSYGKSKSEIRVTQANLSGPYSYSYTNSESTFRIPVNIGLQIHFGRKKQS